MQLLFQYFLKLSIGLVVVYLFYAFVLSRLTFYNLNRLYLSGFSFLAFLFPFINVSALFEKDVFVKNQVISLIPVLDKYSFTISESVLYKPEVGFFNIENILFLLFLAGVIILLIRLGIQYFSLMVIRRSARLLLDDTVKVYQVNKKIIPFSFGSSIFINQDSNTEEELREIIRHEFIHVKQRHTIDIVWIELLCILNWYNPFAWMIRKAVRQNLEFIADNHLLQNGINKKYYQYLLLKVTGAYQLSIANNFNFSSLKKRIAMMNKMKSARVHLIKLLLLLPIVAILLVAFRKNIRDRVFTHNTAAGDAIVVDTIPESPPPPPPPSIPPPPPAPPKLPKGVSSIYSHNSFVTVELDNGTIEKYNLKIAEEKQQFEKKYGRQVFPVVPSMMNPPEVPSPAIKATTISNEPGSLRFPKNVRKIQINDNNEATVTLKNGTVEKYELDNVKEKEEFEKKYGKPISLAQPPTPPEKIESVNAAIDPVVATTSVVSVTPDVKINSPTSVSRSETITTIRDGVATTTSTADVDMEIGDGDWIIVEIPKNTSREELVRIKQRVQKQGYEFIVGTSNYNSRGDLTEISGTIKTKNKQVGIFSAAKFEHVTLKWYYTENSQSFRVIVD